MVTDFGLAKRVEGESQGLTATGQVLGTPSYMPPEQAAGENAKIGPLADVYSLGAVLYCLLTGRPPFQAASAVETLLQVMTREPVRPRQLNPAVPRDLETISLKCLEKDPARRYQSAQELADELQRYLDGRPLHARPVGTVGRTWRWCRRNRALAATLATAACLILTLTAIYVVNLSAKNVRLAASLENEEVARTQAELDRQEAETARQQEATARREAELRRVEAEQAREESLDRLLSAQYEQALGIATRQPARTPRADAGSVGQSGGSAKAVGDSPPEGDRETIAFPSQADLRNEALLALLLPEARDVRTVKCGFFPPSLTPDGRLAAICDAESLDAIKPPSLRKGPPPILRLVDLATGQENGRWTCDASDSPLYAMSSDGRLLATGRLLEKDTMAVGLNVQVWEIVKERKRLQTLSWPRDEKSTLLVRGDQPRLAFSADGKHLAGATSSELVLWNLDTGEGKLLSRA